MKAEIMKERVIKELTNMGYGKEANSLIEKYWNQVEYLSKARDKAIYMVVGL